MCLELTDEIDEVFDGTAEPVEFPYDEGVSFAERVECFGESGAFEAVPGDFVVEDDTYATVRRYAPRMLDALDLTAAPAAQDVLDGVNVLRMNRENLRKVPADAPTSFVKDRWEKLVLDTDNSIDRRFYELCVMAELKNKLRSRDISVVGSRQRL